MKTEIIEALALELTKATIADTDPSTINIKVLIFGLKPTRNH